MAQKRSFIRSGATFVASLLFLASYAAIGKTALDSLDALPGGEAKLKAYFECVSVDSPDSVKIEAAEKGLVLAEKLDDIDYTITFLDFLIRKYYALNDYTRAEKYLKKGLQELKISDLAIKNSEFAAVLKDWYYYVGVIEVYASSDYDEAAEALVKGIALCEKLGDEKLKISSLNLLGTLYRNTGDYDAALKTYEDVKRTAEEKNFDTSFVTACNEIANIYMLGLFDEDKESSVELFKKIRYYRETALKKAREIGYDKGVAFIMHDSGIDFMNIGEEEKAIEYFLRSLEVAAAPPDPNEEVSAYLNVSEVYNMLEKPDSAVYYGRKALDISKEYGLKDLEARALRSISLSYEIKGDFKSAYENFRKYHDLNRDIFNENKSELISDIRIKYQTAETEKKNELLQAENEFKSKRLKYLVILSIVGSLATIIIVLLYVISKRTAKKLEEKTAELEKANRELKNLNDTKDRFFSIISHDLRNPFNAFANMLGAVKEAFDLLEKEDLRETVFELYEHSKQLENLLFNLLQWSRIQNDKIPYNPEKTNLKMLVDNNFMHVKINADKKKIRLSNQVDKAIEVTIDANMILTVLRNLVTNAIKFSPKESEIKVAADSKTI